MSPDDDVNTPSTPAAPATPASTPKPKAPVKVPAKTPASTSPPSSTTSAPAKAPAAKPAAPAKPAAAKPAVAATKPAEKAPTRKWETERRPAKLPATPPPKVVDASGLVLGRAAAVLAKRLIEGEYIVVVNTEKAVVLGGRADVLERYRIAVARGSVRKGPHYPRRPDRIFRRTVRGMLPFVHSKGREAWARISTYVGVPEEFKSLPKETVESAKVRPSLRTPTTLGEISRHVGGSGPW